MTSDQQAYGLVKSAEATILSVHLSGSEDDLRKEFVLAVDGDHLTGEFRMNDNGFERPLHPDEFREICGTSRWVDVVGKSFPVRFHTHPPGILRVAQPGTPVRFYGEKHLSGLQAEEERIELARMTADGACQDALDVIEHAVECLRERAETIKRRRAAIQPDDAQGEAPVETATGGDS